MFGQHLKKGIRIPLNQSTLPRSATTAENREPNLFWRKIYIVCALFNYFN